jgi:hypothetical protein
MKLLLSIILALGIIACTIPVVHAQDATVDLTLSSIPLNPEPGQQVAVTAQSYGADLSQALLSWTYNGKNIASAIGQTQITVTAPASGQSGTLTVTASSSALAVTSATLTITPGSMDLLWEGADSYTPPFYKGRALPSNGGIVRVVAIPTASAPRQLSFNWSQNGDVQSLLSGYGKSSFTFRNDTLTSTEHIEVTGENGTFSANNSVDITPGNPLLLGYLSTDGYIDYANGSATALNTSDTGAIVHFEPYFFSIPGSISKDLSISYSDTDNNPITQGDFTNEIRLSRPDNGGESLFNVIISTASYSLQNLNHLFSVNFN